MKTSLKITMEIVMWDVDILEVDIEYPKQLWSSHKDLPFLPEGRKLEKVEKLVCSIEDKEKCHTHKSFKTRIKSRISIKRCAQSN